MLPFLAQDPQSPPALVHVGVAGEKPVRPAQRIERLLESAPLSKVPAQPEMGVPAVGMVEDEVGQDPFASLKPAQGRVGVGERDEVHDGVLAPSMRSLYSAAASSKGSTES